MLLSKKDLEELAESHQQKADKAYEVHQETGIPRYRREYDRNSDYADAFRMAADAVDDKMRLISMRSNLSILAGSADELLENGAGIDELKAFAKKVIAVAEIASVYTRKSMRKEGEKDG